MKRPIKSTSRPLTENIEDRLYQITIGRTAVVFGAAVTRWSLDSYEVGTIGKGAVDLATAVQMIRPS